MLNYLTSFPLFIHTDPLVLSSSYTCSPVLPLLIHTFSPYLSSDICLSYRCWYTHSHLTSVQTFTCFTSVGTHILILLWFIHSPVLPLLIHTFSSYLVHTLSCLTSIDAHNLILPWFIHSPILPLLIHTLNLILLGSYILLSYLC